MEHHQGNNSEMDVLLYKNILGELGARIEPGSVILDFGCGEGEAVYQFRNLGFKAFGADPVDRFERMRSRCRQAGLIAEGEDIFREISRSPYKIPFDDNTFDFIFSNQVLEHVQDYSAALEEMKRVLKPGGISLHVFPSRWRPIECHTLVPLAGVLRGRTYLSLWAFLGVRNSYQRQAISSQVTSRNFDYLKNCTSYLSRAEIRKQVMSCFGNIAFVEKQYLKHSLGRGRQIYRLAEALPFLTSLFSQFHMRVILFKKGQSVSAGALAA